MIRKVDLLEESIVVHFPYECKILKVKLKRVFSDNWFFHILYVKKVKAQQKLLPSLKRTCS